MFITQQKQLKEFADRAMKSPVLAIDTEFLREKTYFPKLCLLQMATEDETVIVDPFKIDDLSILAPVLECESVVKLFHAGRQDLEILNRECGVVPHPIFDTQVAATLLGYTQQIGYGPLASALCGINLKKKDSFTDWSRRPLSDSQVKYAADDVIYLPKMYAKMTAQLDKRGRRSWLDCEFRAMEDPANYVVDADNRFRRLKRVNQLNRKQLSAAKQLAAWRERRAQRFDIPRKWIITDEQIVEACKREADTIDELYMVRGISDKVSTRDAREMVKCLRDGLYASPEDYPALEGPSKNELNVDVAVDIMNGLVRLRAKQNGIAFQTLASHGDLERVARGDRDVEVLKGWRRQIVGSELLDLLDGKLTLSLKAGKLCIEKVPAK